MNGIQCLRLLYKVVKMPEDIPPPDAATQFIFKQGNEVGALARELFPGGTLIKMFPWDTILDRTREALDRKAEPIYEATFSHQNVYVMVDVLRRVGAHVFDIIEVKQSTRLKKEHIPDMAIQRYVVQGAGLKVSRTFLMHLNTDFIHPDDGELFILEDCTDEVDKYYPEIKPNLDFQKAALESDTLPDIAIGPHCTIPRDCPLMHECWKGIPELSIFNIPNYRGKWQLYEQGIVLLKDIPPEAKLNNNQEAFIRSYMSDQPIIDKEAIRNELAKLVEPIYFLDFETVNWAIPRHEGMRPYRQLPFQWSLHVLKGGELTHKEFLWDNEEDPRPALIESLLDALGDRGSIVVYSSFEKSRLNELAEHFPEYRDRINAIIGRLWDLLDIFRKYYTDASFGGSNSIKNVLPVLVPELSYRDLEIREGGMAMVMFARMIEKDGEEKEKIKQALLKYCERDTLAMIKILEKIKETNGIMK